MATDPSAGTAPEGSASLLADLGRFRRRARGDQRGTSVPLFAFGAFTLGLGLLSIPSDGIGLFGWGFLYAVLGLQAVLAVLAFSYFRRADSVGAGRMFSPYLIMLIVIWLLLSPVFALGCLLAPFATAAIILLSAAAWQRNTLLAIGAVVLGGAGELIYRTAPSGGWIMLLAGVLFIGSFVAYRREKSA